MLQPYAPNEFYADLLVYRLEKLAKAINSVLFYLAAFAFVNVFHASIVRGTGVELAFVFALAVLSQYSLPENLELPSQQNA